MYRVGDYSEAVSLYRRVLFFDQDAANDAYFGIGESYFAIKQFDEARYYYDLAANRSTNDSIKNEIWFRKVASYILDGSYLYAKSELLGFSPRSTYFIKKHAFYSGVIAFKLGKLDDAENFFSTVFSEEQMAEMMLYIKQSKHMLSKKPYLALAMSAIIPGSGQAYVGEWSDAANSFFLNMLTTTLYVYVWHEYALVDAVLAVLPWWHRYYVGGFMNARDITKEKKTVEMDNILTDLLLLYAMGLDDE